MEIDSPDEVFFSSVYPASKESAIYLMRILKSKEYDVDNIFNQFFICLHHLLKSAQFNISDFILPLLQYLREVSAPAIISKKLLISLDLIITDKPDLVQLEPLTSLLSENWKTIEVESLDLVFKIFKFSKTEEELYQYAEEQWRSNQYKKAVYLCSHFGFAEQFNSEFYALEILIKRDEIDLVHFFINKNQTLASTAVKKMCTNKHCKIAGKIVDSAGLDPENFPELVERLSKSSIRYFLNIDDMGLYQVIALVEDYPQLLAYVAEELEYQGKKVKNSWQGGLAALIMQKHPECPIRANSRTAIELMKPRTSSRINDLFSPLQPEFDIQFPLPRELISFVNRPEQVELLDFSGEIVGIDCEWRPAIVKFQKFKVSIIQIATEDRTYIIDLIALNEVAELNQKLEQLMQGKQYKVGVSFEGDRKLLVQSYPHLTAFEKPLVHYVDLVSAYGKVHGSSPGGLAGACELVLRKGLCKHEQRSNWERRPLSESQIHYAALDAYVQILVLQELVKFSGLPLHEFVGDFKSFPSRGMSCEFCSSKTHNKADCPRGKRCKICYRTGHMASNCSW